MHARARTAPAKGIHALLCMSAAGADAGGRTSILALILRKLADEILPWGCLAANVVHNDLRRTRPPACQTGHDGGGTVGAVLTPESPERHLAADRLPGGKRREQLLRLHGGGAAPAAPCGRWPAGRLPSSACLPTIEPLLSMRKVTHLAYERVFM